MTEADLGRFAVKEVVNEYERKVTIDKGGKGSDRAGTIICFQRMAQST